MTSLRPKAKLFVGSVIVAGLALFVNSTSSWHSQDISKFLIYLILSILVSHMKIRLPGIQGSMSVGFLFILISIVQFSYPEAILLAAVSTLLQSVLNNSKRPKPTQVVFNVSQVTMATAAAYWTYHGLNRFGFNHVLLLACSACIYFGLNTWPVSLAIALTENKSTRRVWSECYFWTFPYYLVGASIAGLCGWSSTFTGWQTSLLILPVIYLLYRSYFLYLDRLSEEKRHAEQEKEHVEQISKLHLRTIETLALAIEAKDATTHDHLQRVRIYALELASLLNIPAHEKEALRAAALLHDIGKLGVPEHIINKPGKLTLEEFDKMKTHPVIGAEILQRVNFPYPVVPIVRGHHEKWDGSGYPDGLKGEEIPIGARILSIVDCLDALASDRQYRRALSLDQAMAFVMGEAGKAFDPTIANVLQRHYADLEKMVQEQAAMSSDAGLSHDLHIEAGPAPDAGLQSEETKMSHVDFVASIAAARQEAQMLFELSHDIGSSLRLDDTVSLLSSRLRRLVPFDSLAVFLLDKEELVPAYVVGDNHRDLASLRIPFGEGLVGWVAANRKPIVNGNPAVEYGCSRSELASGRLQSALALPLENIGEIFGVIALYARDKDAFGKEHVRILSSINARVAWSISNALRFQQAETSAVTDYLTGLPNARSLFLHLDQELARCKREHGNLAVLVCDLDGFKQVNDRFGHLLGNRVLEGFSQQLRSVCREYDYVARMGGDEFVLVLPGLTPEAAQERMELINTLARRTGQEVCRESILSVSIGQAFYPLDGSDAESLLVEADQRMYAIKQTQHRQENEPIVARQ